MSDPVVIETADLSKAYDASTEALRGLTLQVPSGSIYGFLGKNGAGKTTTIKTLLGMVKPTGGIARVFGLDATNPQASVAIRQRAAFVSEDKDLIDSMTVDEIARFTASFFPTWRADLAQQYRQTFDLRPAQSVKQLSRGARTKLALLLALCRGAELLILDEPTSGLDPAAAEEVLQVLVRHVATEPLTIFFASHQLSEVDQIADHVGIIDRGRMAVAGALDDLRAQFRRIQVVFDGAAPTPAFRTAAVKRVRRDGRVLTILTSADADAVVAEARALNPVAIDVAPVTLKDIFLESVNAEA